MTFHSLMTPADYWLLQIFDSQAARKGQCVRRSAQDIERKVGWRLFERELERRGFHAVENAGQVIIFCNDAPIRVIR